MNIKQIRRIAVDSNSVKIIVKWFWYYQIENDQWIQHQLSNNIENSFKTFLENKKSNQVSQLNDSTTIFFDKMILKNDKFEEHKLRRRPEFIEEDNKNEIK